MNGSELTETECAVVLVSGVLNGLTPSHIRLFEYASTFSTDGTIIVGVNGDAYNRKKNGERAIPAVDRMYLIKAVRYVSRVIVFEEANPSDLILSLRPRYYVKGPDYKDAVLPEQAACELVGCEVLFRSGVYGYAGREVFRDLA